MKIRWKIAALAGVLIVGLLAVTPLAIAPEPEDDFEECADNDVCFIVQLTNEEVSLSDPLPVFDTWLYVSNPSEDIRREFPLFDEPAGEDNVVVESLGITITDPEGAVFSFFLTPDILPERWDPVVHAFETSRVFFVGFAIFPPAALGDTLFEYELTMTFRGETFSLTVDFEIEVLE